MRLTGGCGLLYIINPGITKRVILPLPRFFYNFLLNSVELLFWKISGRSRRPRGFIV